MGSDDAGRKFKFLFSDIFQLSFDGWWASTSLNQQILGKKANPSQGMALYVSW